MTSDPFLSSSETIKELKNSLFIMNGLQEELATERDLLTTITSQLSSSTKQLQDRIDKFDYLIQEKIQAEMKSMMAVVSANVTHTFIEAATQQTQAAIEKLIQTTKACDSELSQASKTIRFFCKRSLFVGFLIAAIGGIGGGVLVHYYFPKMDAHMISQIKYGETFQDLWSKLDKKDRERLMAISRSPLSSAKK